MRLKKLKVFSVLVMLQLCIINCFNDDTNWKDLEKIYLTKRPQVGTTWVVDLKGTTTAEKVFLRTLQGMINRKQARLYLINSDNQFYGEGEKFWINEYERKGWVKVHKKEMGIDDVIDLFGHEVDGYVAATESEPWSIHAAAVAAMMENGVVAPDAVAVKLHDAGWKELDSTRNKWPDAVSAYDSMVARYKDKLAYPGVALIRPKENLWDFVMQQEIMPMFTRPSQDTWEGVASIIDNYPPNQILYGYVSDDTFEEAIAVERFSSTGKLLVPTHEVSNLSFHVAVQGKSNPRPIPNEPLQNVEKCDPSKVNIVLAMSDGDNLQVPVLQYPRSDYWNTPARGNLPFGWGMGMGLPVVAPGIWEFFRTTMSPNDSIISLMGIAYVNASRLPEDIKSLYFENSFSAMRDSGIHTLWSLDSSLTITDDPLWSYIDALPGHNILDGVLVGYGPSIDKAFIRDTGMPVLISQNGYWEQVDTVKKKIETIMALDPSQRSPINFLFVTNWSISAESYYRELSPLAAQGVRFLTPREAFACMPKIEGIAKTKPTIEPSPGECRPTGTLERFGADSLSAPTLAEINLPVTLPLTPEVNATASIKPGGIIEYTAVVNLAVNSFIYDFHVNRVLSVMIDYGLEPYLLDYAWSKMEASEISIALPLPEGTTPGTVLSLDASNIGAQAKFDGNRLLVTLDRFTADVRLLAENPPPEPVIAVTWTVKHNSDSQSASVELRPENALLNFTLTIGIGEEQGPMVGGVTGLMKCAGPGILAETTIEE